MFLHGVVSWGEDESYGFGHQRPLASRRRLVLTGRRGRGSPDIGTGPCRTDYEVGEPLTVASRVLAERIGAEVLTVPGFYPQVQEAERVNDALATLWDRA